jgi:hypothetical protein
LQPISWRRSPAAGRLLVSGEEAVSLDCLKARNHWILLADQEARYLNRRKTTKKLTGILAVSLLLTLVLIHFEPTP